MAELNPVRIFERLRNDIPAALRRHIIVTGSLAAAYEYRVKLQSQAVNTKDADLIVHPAGDTESARGMSQQLLGLGWRRMEHCTPSPSAEPREQLRAIRLMPPNSDDYFIELLNVPQQEQKQGKEWIPVQLHDGWYGLPSFRFMGLMGVLPRASAEGLEYASPAMMALANLLSHPRVTDIEIESGEFAGLRRCAKDLARVIALASLAGREEVANWLPLWREGIEKCFPKTWRALGARAGDGLREMLADDSVMEQGRKTTESGLLRGKGIDVEALRAFGERLLADCVIAFETLVNQSG